MNTLGLIVGTIFIIVVLYLVYRFIKFYRGRRVSTVESKEVVPKVKVGKNYTSVKGTEIPMSKFSNEYTVSFWIKIDDYKYRFRDKKIVLMRGKEDGSNANPEIYLEPIDNNMVFRIKLQAESYDKSTNKGDIRGDGNGDGNGEGFYGGSAKMIIPEPMTDVKEAFSNISDNDVSTDNIIRYSSEYFNDISGNDVEWEDTSRHERMNAVKYTRKDKFESTDNTENVESTDSGDSITSLMNKISEETKLIDTTPEQYKVELENLLTSFCRLITSIQSKKMAEDMLVQYNGLFDFLNAQFKGESMDVSPELINMINLHRDVFKGIMYLNNFDKVVTAENKEKITTNLKTILAELNTKMSEMNCDVSMGSNVESNTMIKEELMQLLKEKGKKLIVNVARELDKDLVYLNPDLDGFDELVYNGVPLQRWNHIVLSVYNNIADVYHDGKLVKSAVLKGFPEPNTDELHLHVDGGYDGKTSRVRFVNMALSQDDVQSLYKKGPEHKESFMEKIKRTFKF